MRVLLVADSENDALLILRELRRGGYEPTYERVAIPQATKDALRVSDRDVVICDYRLPGLGALGLLEKARDAGSLAPLVVVCGYDEEDAALEVLNIGAHSHVVKASLSRLCAAVQKSLDKAEEQRRTQQRLERSEEHFRNAFESAPIGMAMARPDGRWLKVNKPLCDMLGYTETELLSTTFQAVTHPDDVDVSSESMRRLSSGEVQSYRLKKRYIRKDGHVVWALLNVSPIRDAEGRPLYGIAHIQDITESKRAEEALRESEERFRSAFESAPIGMALVRIEDGRWLEVNQPLCEIIGYPEDELLGLTWQELTHPDDLDADVQQVEQMLRGEIRAFQMEKRYIRKNGRVVWVLLSASLVRDSGGEPLYGIAQVEDITKRKQAEEALKESEELYRTVIEQAQENIFLVDVASRRIMGSNSTFQQALGYSEEELRHKTLYDIVADDPKSVDANSRRVLKQGRSSVGERKYRRKDGSILDVEVSVSVVPYGGGQAFCAVAHDITERVRARELLEERLRALSHLAARLTLDLPLQDTLDAIAEGAVRASTAVACSVILLNEDTEALHLVGSHGFSEEYKAGLRAVYGARECSSNTEGIRARRPVFLPEARQDVLSQRLLAPLHRGVRESPWEGLYAVPLVSRGKTLGEIDFFYLPNQEPSEAEKVFLGAVADQTAVALENARLFSQARAKVVLEERQRLAHELHDSVSQVLYGITLNAGTAREVLEEDAEQAAEPLDHVLSLSEAALAEMRALIFELRPESLEEEGLIAALERQVMAVQSRHKLQINADLCEEPETSLEIKETIYRIAQEALHNVVKHARATDVELSLKCDAERIVLEISDDGIGFDPSGDFPGHLGLRSMRERAERLGGALEVQSTPGKGTRVRTCISTNVAPVS